jgi:putative transposase
MPPHETDHLRLHLIDQLLRLPASALPEVQTLLAQLQGADDSGPSEPQQGPPAKLDWPHAPLHRISAHGTYIVTAATYHKEHHFRGAERLDHLQERLLSLARETGWQLEAWAVFSNHYHFVAHAGPGAEDLKAWVQRLHGATSRHVNLLDRREGREVWYNFWDTRLTYEASYLARLAYVHQNPVKHGLVPAARDYRWCSAGWFERTATRAQVKVLSRFKTDKVHVEDDFDPV